MNNTYILILGGEFALRERVLAGALRASGGMRVLTMAKNRTSPTIKFFDGFIPGVVADAERVLRAVQAHQKENGETPAAVIPMHELTERAAWPKTAHDSRYCHDIPQSTNCRYRHVT